VRDILTKVHGSRNAVNVTRATVDALRQLRSAADVSAMRGVKVRNYVAGQAGAGEGSGGR
jgi:ribosomal protein S5